MPSGAVEPGCGEGRVSLLAAPPMMASIEKLVRAEEEFFEDGGELRLVGGVETIALPAKGDALP